MELEVCFGSDKPLTVNTKMLLQVTDNLYNETAIQVSSEAYQEVVSLSNVSHSLQEVDVEDGVEGWKNNFVLRGKKCLNNVKLVTTAALSRFVLFVRHL